MAENYGGGVAEQMVGAWLRQRGTAADVYLITKGAHPYGGRDRVTRSDIREDLGGSLERLGVSTVDLYLLHRDDERVPVGNVVDWLAELAAEGSIREYGVSNWRYERIAAANEYAERNDLPRIVASSPNFSLAVPSRMPWPGCVSVSGESGRAAREYYASSNVAMLAWSSLAMGYFTIAPDGSGRELLPEEVEVFETPENAERRGRARDLAGELGLTPTQVAVLYVLSQPLRSHAVVGCRSGGEYAELRDATARPLSADQVAYLETGRRTGAG